MPSRPSIILWSAFLTATITAVSAMLAILLGSADDMPLVTLTFSPSNQTEAVYDLLVGASELCSRAGLGNEDWTCSKSLPEDAPPVMLDQIIGLVGFQRSLKLPAFACLLAVVFWLILAICVALVGHLGHKHIQRDRHVHIYTPLFSWSALLVQSFFAAIVCLAAGLAVQLAYTVQDLPEEGYTITRDLGRGLWILLAAAAVCSFALFGSFARTAFHRLHHLHIPTHVQHLPASGQAASSFCNLPQKQSMFQEKTSPLGSAVVMRPSWVQRKLSTEVEDAQVEEDANQPSKTTRIVSYAPSNRSSIADSLVSGALSQPPGYKDAEGKASARQR